LLVDGGAAAQGAVVFGDLLEPLIGHAAPGGDVAQEGDDVVLALGAAEGGEQDRVVGRSAHRSLSVSRRIRWADGAGRADGSDGADGPAGLAEPTGRRTGRGRWGCPGWPGRHLVSPGTSPPRPRHRSG